MATPIGNLGDVTLRAMATLRAADAIGCEDTRVTAKLLTALGLPRVPLFPCHEHNEDKTAEAVLDRLRAGQVVALVSDAGTPLVSDPGYRLVRRVVAEGLPVTVVPGPSAPLAALLLSGLPSDRFLFAGFAPNKSAARRTWLAELAAVPATLVTFESPQRLAASLADMAATLGDRPAAVARELTKMFEEVRRGLLSELAAHYAEAGPPKGEVVVVIGPPEAASAASDDDLDSQLRAALKSASIRDAAATVAAASGRPKREVYARALAISQEEE